MPAEYHRYVAIGDSQTEGLGDGDDRTGLRGFADRLAEQLAATNPGLDYANLAVRGRLTAQIHAEQLGPALELKPDVATVVAGMNDLIRPGFDAAAVLGHLDAMFAALTAAGATVVTLTFPDVARITPLAKPLRPRVLALNAGIRSAASRYGVIVAETESQPVVADPRLWSVDRLHASPLGHQLIAAALAHALGLPGADDGWTTPLPPQPVPNAVQAAITEIRWIGTCLGPWLARRIRGRSSGDGRSAKRPRPLPVEQNAYPPRNPATS